MSRWLQSGIRRDLCVVIHALDGPTGQEVKTALEERYDDRADPRTVHGALDELETAGYVTTRVDGLHDRYALTDAGEAALLDHYEWLRESIVVDENGTDGA
ncbi:MAG: PadR family transcriptional regulator [Halobacteriales archaeon]